MRARRWFERAHAGWLRAEVTALLERGTGSGCTKTAGVYWEILAVEASLWTFGRRGEQAAVETPGTNEKRYLVGAIHWRTGWVILTEGKPKEERGAALFVRQLDDLRRAFHRY
jgi:hypothetical protein